MPKIAIAASCLDAYSELPRPIQKKTKEFMEKFRREPTASAINYEALKQMRDPKLRSVRIDQTYRAIIIHPPAGDVYTIVWVDHHDEAYRWAKNKVFDVNDRGALEVYEVDEAEGAPEVTAAPAPPVAGFLDKHSDADLLLVGVPGPLIPALRAVADQESLDRLLPHLPPMAADGVSLLAAGYDLDQTLAELTRSPEPEAPPEPVGPVPDKQDFEKALSHPEAQQHFHIVQSEEDLAEILNAPLERWRIFLHPTQRRLVQQSFHGPARVLGGAGTGKTVVLLHRAAHLARKVFTGVDDRILVTTYTRNLAHDLGENLERLCLEVAPRIEVKNLHSWAGDYLASREIKHIAADETKMKAAMDKAVAGSKLDFPRPFYSSEWERVVQANDCLTQDEYFAAPRVGRGTRLSRANKAELWKVFQDYRSLLQDGGLTEWADLVREARLQIEQSPGSLPYRAVLADEAQDFRLADLRLLRAIVAPGDNDIFVVGDAHQRIYGHKAALGKAGIAIRGRSRQLRINYRTTQQIRNFAVALLEGHAFDDLDGGSDDLKGYRSLRVGVPPEVRLCGTLQQEVGVLAGRLRSWTEQGLKPEEICVSARSNRQVADYAAALNADGLPTTVIDTHSEKRLKPGYRIATMHRLKGLEFRAVALVGVHEGSVPVDLKNYADAASKEDHLLGERCLVYVAATRARDLLLVTGYGKPSAFLAQ